MTGRTINPGIGQTQSYNYQYSGDPRYMWHTWKARFSGFDWVKEIDAANNYVKHYFYTTGLVDNKDADKLTGKEYKTEWYNSGDVLLKQAQYTWTPATSQNDKYAFVAQFDSVGSGDGDISGVAGLAVDSAGNIYVSDGGNHRIQKYYASGVLCRQMGQAWQWYWRVLSARGHSPGHFWQSIRG